MIEDDPGIVVTLRRLLTEEGHEICVETRGDLGLKRARSEDFDVVLTDMRLPGMGGLELVRAFHAEKPQLPIILMTAHGTTETAIEAMKAGAYDYLVKPFEMPELIDLMNRAVTSRRLMAEKVQLGKAEIAGDALIGHSREMQSIYKEIGRVAPRPVSVLIRGETGTGKELIARAIYQHSDRSKAPFVAINCAAIPESLLESELFGHERGAFTGAETRRVGRFEQADRGTIFLDEIGDMTPGTQSKLLRVLQERCIQRLGGKENIPVDVRVIAATHRDLEEAIRLNQFREDLYYRLSVVVIRLPPLRERREDIPELTQFFLQKHSVSLGVPNPSLRPEILAALQAHSWAGNVRELENCVRKVLLLAQGYAITIDHVRAALAGAGQIGRPGAQTLSASVDQLLAAAQRGETEDVHARVIQLVEKELFGRAIELAQGNQAKAARWLGVSRFTMREKLIQFGLHPGQDGAKS
jgi:nitrogen regulation protein NR(I)